MEHSVTSPRGRVLARDATARLAATEPAELSRPPGRPRLVDADTASWLFQVVVSALALILLSPILLAIAALIKATDGGSVFYRGERVGKAKRTFRIYKFRTMREGAENQIGPRLLSGNDRDLYCTRIGRFLKRSKLDELPQLLNVIRGEMRWIGPRPVRPVFLERFEREIPNYAERFATPPGITGIAQVRGGYYTSPREKLRYELFYIRKRTFLLDLKIVLLTLVKILNRWLNAGLFALFLLLFVSLAPTNWQPYWYVFPFGVRVGLLYLCILAAVVWLFVRHGPRDFSLYRSPLNVPMFLFLVPAAISVSLAEDPTATLRRAGYYLVTGFLVSFLIVNSLSTRRFAEWTVRLIALTAVVISMLGLFEVSLVYRAVNLGSPAGGLEGALRISSTLGNPVSLATYLVLGIPLLIAQTSGARSSGGRDFWLVCTTLCCVAFLFTQARVAVVALLVAGTVFFSRRAVQGAVFAAVLVVIVGLLASLGVPRFTASELRRDAAHWVERNRAVLDEIPATRWLVGGAAPTALTSEPGGRKSAEPQERIANMHLMLMLEHGVLAWIVIMGFVGSALRAMKQAHDRTSDAWLKSVLRGIIAGVLGFLVSMNALNALHSVTLQIFFWSLIGTGLGIAIHIGGRERHNLIWAFGDAGD